MQNKSFVQTRWLNSFRKRLRRNNLRPIFVQWISTKKCNLNCMHCGTDAGRASADELTTKEICKAIDGLAQLRCKYLSVTGGEPLLRKDLFEVLRYAQSKNIKTSLVTNGYATEENFSRLRMLKLHVVSVSIDGYRQKHDIVRGKPGSYERCLNSLKLYRKMGVRTRQVATVVLEENINDIQLMIKDAFAAGCTRYRLQLLIPEGRARNKKLPFDLVKKALYTINKERRKGRNVFAADNFGYLGPDESKLRPYNFFCGCGWWTFTIMENGDIMGCPLTDYPELSEGNIRNKDLKEIWRDGFQRFRDKSLVSLPDICQKCEYISICRGACWAQRVNTDRFCFLKLAKEIKLG